MVNSTIESCGALIYCTTTKRYLFLLRNSPGKYSGTWGLVGGKKEPKDLTAIDALKREIQEEVGKTPAIKKIIPLELFTSNDQQFHYNTYVLLVDKEFMPDLNDEHHGYAWCDFDAWPKPLHQGLKSSLSNKTIKAKIEVLLNLI